MDRIDEIIPDDKSILLIKLHGSTKNEYKEIYKALFKKDARIIYIEDLDITPFLALADVMVSDVSSAMMEFAALNKPIILFNNPNWKKYQYYNPSDIEFKWRDIGVQVNNVKEMKEAVMRSFVYPEEFENKRKYYTDQLLANKNDGSACKKIIDASLELYYKQNNKVDIYNTGQSKLMKMHVIGAGSWGTTLAHLFSCDNKVYLWTHTEEQAYNINKDSENKKYMPGLKLSSNITAVKSFTCRYRHMMTL